MMKARASQGCPHAAEWLKNYELEKAKEAKEKAKIVEQKQKPKRRTWKDAPPIEDRIVVKNNVFFSQKTVTKVLDSLRSF